MFMKKLILPVSIFILASFSFPFIYWPEMMNYPFFLHLGWLPYKDWSMVYTPILPYTLKFFYDLFGYRPETLHLFGTVLGAITTTLIARKSKSILAAIFFIISYLAFGGNSVWFDIFLTPLIILMYYSPVPAFLFGLCVLTKQTSFYLLPPILLPVIKKPFWFLFLLFLFFIYLILNNILFDFLNWGVKFVFLLPKNGDLLWPTIKQSFVVLAFLISLLLTNNKKAIIFSLFSLLFAFPRFEFFHLIPFLAIFTIAVSNKPILFLIPFVAVIPLLYLTFSLGNRFLVKYEIPPNKTVYSLNGPDQIYFLNNVEPAVRPWVDQLPWQMEYARVAYYQAFITAKPDIIITRPYLKAPVQGLGAYQPEKIWEFVNANYKMVKTYDDGTQILERN